MSNPKPTEGTLPARRDEPMIKTSELRRALAHLDKTALEALRQLIESPDEEVAAPAAALWARYGPPLVTLCASYGLPLPTTGATRISSPGKCHKE
jgi:hypothetical protein